MTLSETFITSQAPRNRTRESIRVEETLITDRKKQNEFLDSLLDSVSKGDKSFSLIRSSHYDMIQQAILQREFGILRERSPYDIEFRGKRVNVDSFVKSRIDKKVRKIETAGNPESSTRAENILKSGLLTDLLIRFSEPDLIKFYNHNVPVGGDLITELHDITAGNSSGYLRRLLKARGIIPSEAPMPVDPVKSTADSTPEEVQSYETLTGECKREIATRELRNNQEIERVKQENIDRFNGYYREFCNSLGLDPDAGDVKSKMGTIFRHLTDGKTQKAHEVIRSISGLENIGEDDLRKFSELNQRRIDLEADYEQRAKQILNGPPSIKF